MTKNIKPKVNVTLNKAVYGNTWTTFCKPLKKLKKGDRLIFSKDFSWNIVIVYQSLKPPMLQAKKKWPADLGFGLLKNTQKTQKCMHRFTQVFYSLGFGARCSQDGPKRLQDAPRCSKMGARCSQDAPKMVPRCPKRLPRWAQEAPSCSKMDPRCAKMSPRCF